MTIYIKSILILTFSGLICGLFVVVTKPLSSKIQSYCNRLRPDYVSNILFFSYGLVIILIDLLLIIINIFLAKRISNIPFVWLNFAVEILAFFAIILISKPILRTQENKKRSSLLKTKKRTDTLAYDARKMIKDKRQERRRHLVVIFSENKSGLTLDKFISKVLNKIDEDKKKYVERYFDYSFYSFNEDTDLTKKYNIINVSNDLAYVIFLSNGELFEKNNKKSFYGEDIWNPKNFNQLITDLMSAEQEFKRELRK